MQRLRVWHANPAMSSERSWQLTSLASRRVLLLALLFLSFTRHRHSNNTGHHRRPQSLSAGRASYSSDGEDDDPLEG
jgi:hypothetical protein